MAKLPAWKDCLMLPIGGLVAVILPGNIQTTQAGSTTANNHLLLKDHSVAVTTYLNV